MNGEPAIPLLVVAGSPGAGKTTLLARWMGDPAMAETGVLVNEPAAVAIDAHLVGPSGATRSLCGGCACCAKLAEVPDALAALADGRRGAARVERVVMELCGLADPAPLLAVLEGDARLRERFPWCGVATVVDARAALEGIQSARARSQIAAADVLLVAKADLASQSDVQRLVEGLARVNRDAEILLAEAAADPGRVWESAARATGRELRRLEAAVASDGAHGDVEVHTLALAAPVELSGFCLRLAAFLHAERERVLRVKGLVAVQGRRGPAVIQAVGATLHPVRSLRGWPAGAPRNTLVVMARGMAEGELRAKWAEVRS